MLKVLGKTPGKFIDTPPHVIVKNLNNGVMKPLIQSKKKELEHTQPRRIMSSEGGTDRGFFV